MKRSFSKLKKIYLLGVLLILSFLSGCWDAKELANLAIVAAVGIDIGDQPEKILITIQVIKPGDVKSGSGGSEGGKGQTNKKAGGQQAFLVLQSSGKTVAEAFRNFSLQLNRELYLSDNQIIIYGRDFARQGIRTCVDYFIRTREPRETMWILVADGKASDVLDTPPSIEKIPAIEITRLIQNSTFSSLVASATQQDILNRLLSKTQAPYSTLVKVTGETDKKPELVGTAIFKDERLKGQLDKEETRGFLWIIGKVNKGIITIRSPKKEQIDVGILTAKSEMNPLLKSGKITIQVKIKADCAISGGTISEDPTKMKVLKSFEKQVTKEIYQEIKAALKKSYDLKSDIFGFGEAIHRRYPKEWKKLEPQWDQAFLQIPVKLKINSTIKEFGLEYKPIVPK